ncbi:hypothetical protein AC062_1846 [Pasteurellaceae bacterium NI1060]|nr:hypothetical protein AC062_1846 [Pasteurellaceae bacterium NI1060]
MYSKHFEKLPHFFNLQPVLNYKKKPDEQLTSRYFYIIC